MPIWRRGMQSVGVASICLAVLGSFLQVNSVRRAMALAPSLTDAPYFWRIVVWMSTIDAAFLLAMIVIAIGLVRLKRKAVLIYTCLYVALSIYVFIPGMFWLDKRWGASLASATGLGEMGIAALLFIPFPFVYPIISVAVVNVASRKLMLK